MTDNDHTSGRRSLGVKMGGILLLCVVGAAGVGVGYLLSGGAPVRDMDHGGPHATTRPQTPAAPEVWTCSMHPEVRLPGPGSCPVCQMPLVKAKSDVKATRTDPNKLVLGENARKMMQVATVAVKRQAGERSVHMVGKVAYDETRVAYLTAWTAGRIDRLFVDFTGTRVRKGEHMVSMYSPDLIVAQGELLQAIKALGDAKSGNDELIGDSSEQMVKDSRDKLRLKGLTAAQIADIERSGKVQDHITITAPQGGVVVAKHAEQGMYVKTGTRIYTIADLSRVWINLDAYESDLAWLRYGQAVEISTSASEGETFKGTIAFISPVLNEKTRTVQVRVNADNRMQTLKPGMFTRATVAASVDAAGHLIGDSFAGKWICPMHPAVLKSSPGKCDICEMPLEDATKHVSHAVGPKSATMPLIVPTAAVMKTGRRAIVFIEDPKAAEPTFLIRQLKLGPKVQDGYVVLDGIKEGDRVVAHGTFLVDSAAQLARKQSMMSLVSARVMAMQPATAAEGAFVGQMNTILDAYLKIHAAAFTSDLSKAISAAGDMYNAVASADTSRLDKNSLAQWNKSAEMLLSHIENASAAADIKELRTQLRSISTLMIQAVQQFGGRGRTVRQFHCPMAFGNSGADWLQLSKVTQNPYESETMPKCGSLTNTFGADSKEAGGK